MPAGSSPPAAAEVGAAVAEQYHRYPFPPRDPADERHRLVVTTLGDLTRAGDLLWGGRRASAALSVLDAGCGTGDSAIYMAQQAPDAHVVALDASASSLQVTARRARARRLQNVEPVQASLLDLPRLGLPRFDYIVCSGVLHHLPRPEEGLQALVGAMQPDGGLGLMLYARHGRTPVYQVQELLRRLGGAEPLDDRIALAGEVLAALPEQHLFKAGRLEDQLLDLRTYGAAGVVDLLLHACDRAYTVSEVHALVRSASLDLLAFHRPVLYQPERYALTEGVRRRVARLGPVERQAVAELLHGRMIKHEVYAARSGGRPPLPSAASPAAAVTPRIYESALAAWLQRLQPVAQPFHLASTEGFTLTLELSATDCALLAAVDGRRPLAAVFDHAAAAVAATGTPTSRHALAAAWHRLATELEAVGYLGYAWASG
jgi:SAM-dependent methyltransferase